MEAVTVRDGGCNRMWWRLQPYVMESVTICDGGCNRMWMEAATVCDGGCNLCGWVDVEGEAPLLRPIVHGEVLHPRRHLVQQCSHS